MDLEKTDLPQLLKELNAIGIALSAEKDHNRLLEMILIRSKEITNSDGGTLYTRKNDDLKFEIMHTDSLDIHLGGVDGEPITFYPIHLYKDNGEPNTHNVAACAVLGNKTINIPDAYTNDEFDFSGTRGFDEKMGYRSQSFLTVPMTNHENEIIGVLQLINSQDPETGEVNAFTAIEQQLVESLASQAAVTITNQSLIEAQKELFDALVKLIADAIDEKSPYTAGHCRRVPVLSNMIAHAVNDTTVGPLKDFSMTEEEIYELDIAAWLHDCGKITTPECVVDKATKLETIFDKVNLVDARIEILKRDAEIAALKKKLKEINPTLSFSDGELKAEIAKLEQDKEFIRGCNIGGETISEASVERINQIANNEFVNPDGEKEKLLNEEDVQNLQIGRGTLNYREREIINNHVAVTIKMLESLPYPKHLKKVPEYAGGHHEKVDGTGYPNQLKGDDMSIPARMVAIADVFEALTAKDRPYKKAMSLSQSLTILGRMKLDGHVDPDLFDVFVWEKIYLKYANKHLAAEQIDDVDLEQIPGYSPLPSN
jgi:HD-GYP domain-containing protein (c-di-GMP phosphodiesterase class II)